jgi:DNA-directed RNA polymerase alpha subunit
LGLKKRPAEKARFGWVYWHNEWLVVRINRRRRKKGREAMNGTSDQQRTISWRNARIAAEQIKAQFPFRHRGLSDRTIQALVDCSIDSPERLLFMTEKEIQLIPGVGKVSMAEIVAYRVKFIR